MKTIYLDTAAATPLTPVARQAMRIAEQHYGNPSSFHAAGRAAAELLEGARSAVARFLRARSDEIIFCSSGSEANSLALHGVLSARGSGDIITAPTEHVSILSTCDEIQATGSSVVMLGVDECGRIREQDVLDAITPSTALVTLMYVNNEIGTIHPIARIGKAIAQWRKDHHTIYPLFHVDACQATTTLPMDVQRLSVDLMTLNGAKAYGPHGSAVLFVRRGVPMHARVRGGTQEHGLRAGTEDIAGACGLAAALSVIQEADRERMTELRDYFMDCIRKELPDAHFNGPLGNERAPGNVSVSLRGCDSEQLLLELDSRGVAAGSGSACTAHSVEPSHVLVAIRTPAEYQSGVVRFSLGRTTTRKDLLLAARALAQSAQAVRRRRAAIP